MPALPPDITLVPRDKNKVSPENPIIDWTPPSQYGVEYDQPLPVRTPEPGTVEVNTPTAGDLIPPEHQEEPLPVEELSPEERRQLVKRAVNFAEIQPWYVKAYMRAFGDNVVSRAGFKIYDNMVKSLYPDEYYSPDGKKRRDYTTAELLSIAREAGAFHSDNKFVQFLTGSMPNFLAGDAIVLSVPYVGMPLADLINQSFDVVNKRNMGIKAEIDPGRVAQALAAQMIFDFVPTKKLLLSNKFDPHPVKRAIKNIIAPVEKAGELQGLKYAQTLAFDKEIAPKLREQGISEDEIAMMRAEIAPSLESFLNDVAMIGGASVLHAVRDVTVSNIEKGLLDERYGKIDKDDAHAIARAIVYGDRSVKLRGKRYLGALRYFKEMGFDSKEIRKILGGFYTSDAERMAAARYLMAESIRKRLEEQGVKKSDAAVISKLLVGEKSLREMKKGEIPKSAPSLENGRPAIVVGEKTYVGRKGESLTDLLIRRSNTIEKALKEGKFFSLGLAEETGEGGLKYTSFNLVADRLRKEGRTDEARRIEDEAKRFALASIRSGIDPGKTLRERFKDDPEIGIYSHLRETMSAPDAATALAAYLKERHDQLADLEVRVPKKASRRVVTEDELKEMIGNDYPLEMFEEAKVKKGDPEYEEGVTKYRIIQGGRYLDRLSSDTRRPVIEVGKDAPRSAAVEESAHAVYEHLDKIDPQLKAEILDWERRISRGAENVPAPGELFVQAFVYDAMGYAEDNPAVARRVSFPRELYDRFAEHMGGWSVLRPLIEEPVQKVRVTAKPEKHKAKAPAPKESIPQRPVVRHSIQKGKKERRKQPWEMTREEFSKTEPTYQGPKPNDKMAVDDIRPLHPLILGKKAKKSISGPPIADRNKLARLVRDFRKGKWDGPPILVLDDQALTGTHRLWAAKKAGLKEVPVYRLTRVSKDEAQEITSVPRDDSRLEVLRRLGYKNAARIVEHESNVSWWRLYPEVEHESILRQALKEGKPIPQHVLEEYKGAKWADEALKKIRHQVVPAKRKKQVEEAQHPFVSGVPATESIYARQYTHLREAFANPAYAKYSDRVLTERVLDVVRRKYKLNIGETKHGLGFWLETPPEYSLRMERLEKHDHVRRVARTLGLMLGQEAATVVDLPPSAKAKRTVGLVISADKLSRRDVAIRFWNKLRKKFPEDLLGGSIVDDVYRDGKSSLVVYFPQMSVKQAIKWLNTNERMLKRITQTILPEAKIGYETARVEFIENSGKEIRDETSIAEALKREGLEGAAEIYQDILDAQIRPVYEVLDNFARRRGADATEREIVQHLKENGITRYSVLPDPDARKRIEKMLIGRKPLTPAQRERKAVGIEHAIEEYEKAFTAAWSFAKGVSKGTQRAQRAMKKELREGIREAVRIAREKEKTKASERLERVQQRHSQQLRKLADKIEAMRDFRKSKDERAKLLMEMTEGYLPKTKRQLYVNRIYKAKTGKSLERLSNAVLDAIMHEWEKNEKGLWISDIKKTVTKIHRIGLNKFSDNLREAAETVLETFQMKGLSPKMRSKLESRLDYLERNPDANIPQKYINELKRLETPSLQDMTTEQLEAISTALHRIYGQQVLMRKLRKMRVRRWAEQGAEAVIADVMTRYPMRGQEIVEPGRERPSHILRRMSGDYITPRAMIFDVDGGREGVLSAVLVRDLGERGDRRYNEVVMDILGKLDDFRSKNNISTIPYSHMTEELLSQKIRKLAGAEHVKVEKTEYEVGPSWHRRKIRLTPLQQIAIWGHAQNWHNIKHLTSERGGIVMPGKEGRPPVVLTLGDVMRIVHDVESNPKKYALAEQIFLLFNGELRNYMDTASLEMNGHRIAYEYPYWPIKTVSRVYQPATHGESNIAIDIRRMENYFLEGMGILKSRVKGASNPIVLEDALEALNRVTHLTALYYGYAPSLRRVKALMSQRIKMADGAYHTIEGEVSARMGRDVADRLREVIRRIETSQRQYDKYEKMQNKIFNLFSRGTLGWNIFVRFVQPVSYLSARQILPDDIWFKGLTSKPASWEEMADYSPNLWARKEGRIDLVMGDLSDAGRILRFVYGPEAEKFSMRGMRWITEGDRQAVGRIFNAVKYWVEQMGFEPGTEQHRQLVGDLTDYIVSRTQPSYGLMDRPRAVLDRAYWIRTLMRFMSQRVKNDSELHMSVTRVINVAEDAKREATEKGLRRNSQEYNDFIWRKLNESPEPTTDKRNGIDFGPSLSPMDHLKRTIVNIMLYQGATVALIHTVRDTWRNPKEYGDPLKFFSRYIKNLLTDTAGSVLVGPYAMALSTLVGGYSVTDPVGTLLNQTASAALQLTGRSKKTSKPMSMTAFLKHLPRLVNTVMRASRYVGLSETNLFRDFVRSPFRWMMLLGGEETQKGTATKKGKSPYVKSRYH